MNFGKCLVDKLLQHKNKAALINGTTGEVITYNELAHKILSVASSLIQRGVQEGDIVAICSENRIEYLITQIAVYYVGAVITFINIAYTKDEVIHAANITKPKYCFISPNAYKLHYNTLKEFCPNVFIYTKTTENGVSFNELVSGRLLNNLTPADHQGKVKTSLILYSSGTTGLPKGARITNLNLITTLYQQQLTTRDLPVLTVAPWCNTMGVLTLTDGLSFGRTIIFLERFDENIYLQVIQKYKVGILMIAPPTLIVMSKSPNVDKYDVSSVELMHSGGAPLDSDVVDVETRNILGPNKPGEVCVKGLSLFDGYVGKERGDDYDEDGYFKTGDVAYYDEEGYFFIVDRIKELIKYKAWQVSPSELESILLLHPSVKDCGVIGIPDSTAGELPTAFIVKKDGSSVTEKEIVDFVTTKVSPWKRLRGGVIFIEEIPKTGSGKILRRNLRAMVKNTPKSKL
ncbi:unnamed protein product [Diatraea saccharalis]|uniref:Luciferin 4-monooxygenase n=1 Tax=Diatraea saccharalis TaxID=40085 RepID=A0A9N9RGZ9_9NEOP|nr:unnamed protein product [Diatraea saccharalis]